jgi:hypothetical protein
LCRLIIQRVIFEEGGGLPLSVARYIRDKDRDDRMNGWPSAIE